MGAKKKEKVIEDKTFGLKNKKGGKAQKFIANVEKQVKGGGNPDFRKQEAEKKRKRKKRKRRRNVMPKCNLCLKLLQHHRRLKVVSIPSQCFVSFSSKIYAKKVLISVNSAMTPIARKRPRRGIFTKQRKRKPRAWKIGMKRNWLMLLVKNTGLRSLPTQQV